MFQNALWLAKQELKYQWLGVLSTFIFCIVVGALTGSLLLDESVGFRVNSNSFDRFLLDLIFVGMGPSFAALFMSRPYLSYKAAKQNPYVKRMALLRTLPISTSALAFSRTIFMLMTLFIMSVAFYGTVTFILLRFDSALFATAGEFIVFMFVWFGFMLALGGMNPYVEYGRSAKMLHIFPYFYILLFLVFERIFYLSFGVGIVEQSIELVKNIGWPMAIASIFIGTICCYVWNQLLKGRLEKRDYV